MLAAALIFLVVVLLVLLPLAQRQRERDLAARLKQSHSAIEAQLMVDSAIRSSRHESDFIEKVRETVWPGLFR